MDPKIFSQLLGTAGKILSNAPSGKNGKATGIPGLNTANIENLLQGKLGNKSSALQFAMNKMLLEENALLAELEKLYKEFFAQREVISKFGGNSRELIIEKTQKGFDVKNKDGDHLNIKEESSAGLLLQKAYLLRIAHHIKKEALSGGGITAYAKLINPETYDMSSAWAISIHD